VFFFFFTQCKKNICLPQRAYLTESKLSSIVHKPSDNFASSGLLRLAAVPKLTQCSSRRQVDADIQLGLHCLQIRAKTEGWKRVRMEEGRERESRAKRTRTNFNIINEHTSFQGLEKWAKKCAAYQCALALLCRVVALHSPCHHRVVASHCHIATPSRVASRCCIAVPYCCVTVWPHRVVMSRGVPSHRRAVSSRRIACHCVTASPLMLRRIAVSPCCLALLHRHGAASSRCRIVVLPHRCKQK